MTDLFVNNTETFQIGGSKIISCEFTEQVNNDTDVRYGCAIASSVTVRVCDSIANAPAPGTKLTYYRVDDNNNRTKIGIFYVDKPTVDSRTSYKFDAYDTISRLDKNLSPWLYELNQDWPTNKTLSGFAASICTQCGVSFIAPEDFPNRDYIVQRFYADDLTGRTLMGLIAELAGKNVVCTNSGIITLRGYSPRTTIRITPSKAYISSTVTGIPYYIDSLKYESYATETPHRVQIKQSTDENDIGVIYPSTATGSTYQVVNNLFLSRGTVEQLTTVAQNLYGVVSQMSYTPAKFRIIPNETVHAGDIVTVSKPNGGTFSTIIMKSIRRANGVSCESTGNKSLDSSGAVVSRTFTNLTGRMLSIKADIDGLRVLAADLDGNMAELNQTVEGWEGRIEDAEEAVTAFSAKAGKIDLLLTEGSTSAANMQLTSAAINMIVNSVSDDIIDEISTEGFVSTSTFNQTATEIRTSITNTNTNLTTLASQTADKFSWLIKSGTDSTDFRMTDRAVALIVNAVEDTGFVSTSTFNQTATEIRASITNTNNTLSTVSQKADKIDLLLTNGSTSAANMELTPSAISMIVNSVSDDIIDEISTEGFVSTSTFNQTATEIRASITDTNNNLALVSATAGKIGWLIASGDSASNFTMTAKALELVSANISLSGYVTFSDLSNSGHTTINGSNITSGTINAERIGARTGTSYVTFDSPISQSQIVGIGALNFGPYASITKYDSSSTSPLEITSYMPVRFSQRPLITVSYTDAWGQPQSGLFPVLTLADVAAGSGDYINYLG